MEKIKSHLRITCLGVIIVTIAMGISYAQPKLDKRNIPSGTPPKVRREIARLYSSWVSKRQNAIYKLGEMREEAAGAVPFLISMFEDYPPGECPFPWGYQVGSAPAIMASDALSKIGESAIEPLIVAIRDKNNWESRSLAARALGLMGRKAIEPLIKLLEDRDGDVRKFACWELVKSNKHLISHDKLPSVIAVCNVGCNE